MWEYTDKVNDHFRNPRNVGAVENPDGTRGIRLHLDLSGEIPWPLSVNCQAPLILKQAPRSRVRASAFFVTPGPN